MTIDVSAINQMNQSTYNASKRVADLNFNTFEKLFSLQSNMVKSMYEDSVANLESMTSITSPQEALAFQSNVMRGYGEKALSNYKENLDVIVSAREEMTKLTEENAKIANSNMETIQQLVSENAEKVQASVHANVEKVQNTMKQSKAAK